MRKRRLLLNTLLPIVNEVIAIICGLILPRQILINYGSEVNGLVSSVLQFLGIITIMDMGVGAVIQSALYKPLAERNNLEISKIMLSSKRFFNRIAIILVSYTTILMVLYPAFVPSPFDKAGTAILVFALSINLIAEYFFGVSNQLLVYADQRTYVFLTVASLTTILNTFSGVILIKSGTDIQTVKILASAVLLLRPLALYAYVRKNYKIEQYVSYDKDPIVQKWDALYQHIATFIVDRTDIVVLTLLSSLKNISVYSVYQLVVGASYKFFTTTTIGVQALLGDMIARKEEKKIFETVSQLEWAFHSLGCVLFGCTGVLMVPFVQVYTKGVKDITYYAPVFSLIITIAYFFCSLRSVYITVIKAAGHYKQTQKGAIIEAILNIIISVIAVWKFGLAGVAAGTAIAMSYRTFYLINYLRSNIINRPAKFFIKNLSIDGVYFMILWTFALRFQLESLDYVSWFIMAIKVFFVAIGIECILNLLFYRKVVKKILVHFLRKPEKRIRLYNEED